MTAPVDP